MKKSEQCTQTIYGDWGRGHKCARKAVKDGFCKQHHPDAVAARKKKSDELSEQRMKASPYYKLKQAHERIKELEAEIKQLKGEDS